MRLHKIRIIITSLLLVVIFVANPFTAYVSTYEEITDFEEQDTISTDYIEIQEEEPAPEDTPISVPDVNTPNYSVNQESIVTNEHTHDFSATGIETDNHEHEEFYPYGPYYLDDDDIFKLESITEYTYTGPHPYEMPGYANINPNVGISRSSYGIIQSSIPTFDLTVSAETGETTQNCIWVKEFDKDRHWERCLNHSETGTFNGIFHTNGRRNDVAHSFQISGISSCSPSIPAQIRTCNTGCGFTEAIAKPEHVQSDSLSRSLTEFTHFYQCANCKQRFQQARCTLSNGSIITCRTGGTCSTCGNVFSARALCANYLDAGICNYCNSRIANTSITIVSQSGRTTVFDVSFQSTVGNLTFTNLLGYNGLESQGFPDSGTFIVSNEVITSTSISARITHIAPSDIHRRYNICASVKYSNGTLSGSIFSPVELVSPYYTAPSINGPSITGTVGKWEAQRTINMSATSSDAEAIQLGISSDAEGTDFIIPLGGAVRNGTTFSRNNIPLLLEAGTTNQTFYVVALDDVGNKSTRPFTLSHTDMKPPSNITVTGLEPNVWRSQKQVRVSATDEGIGEVQIGFNNESEYSLASNNGNMFFRDYIFTGEVSEPQTRTFFLKDGLDNKISYDFPIGWLDNVPPVISMLPRVNQWTNSDSIMLDVEASDNLSGIKHIRFSDGTELTGANTAAFNIFENGIHTSYAEDQAGNITPIEVDYQWFDRTAPTIRAVSFKPKGIISFLANLIGLGGHISHKHVYINIEADDTPEGNDSESGVSYMYHRVLDSDDNVLEDWTETDLSGAFPSIEYDMNGYVEVYVKDAAGNVSETEKHRIIIDTTPPLTAYRYSTLENTMAAVTVTLTGWDDAESSGFRGWQTPDNEFIAEPEIQYVFTENDTKTFIAYKNSGTKTEVPVTVSNIIKEEPKQSSNTSSGNGSTVRPSRSSGGSGGGGGGTSQSTNEQVDLWSGPLYGDSNFGINDNPSTGYYISQDCNTNGSSWSGAGAGELSYIKLCNSNPCPGSITGDVGMCYTEGNEFHGP